MTTLTMNLTSIDTLAFAKRMQKAGLPQHTAEELAEALKETQSQSIENFATKVDLENKITKSESKLELKIESVKNEILFRVGRMVYLATGLIISSIGVAVAILKF